MPDALVIRMQYHDAECSICGAPTDMSFGVPHFNGDLVSNDFPDWLYRTGGGSRPACWDCYLRHEMGELQTFDHYYRHLVGGLEGGAGI
jgi:hypothetical protein